MQKSKTSNKAKLMSSSSSQPPSPDKPVKLKSCDATMSTNLKIKLSDKNSSPNEETDNEDATTPFKANTDTINLSTSEPDKTGRKSSRNKSLFKTIFCCFSSSTRNRNSGKTVTANAANSTNGKKNVSTGSFINSNNFNTLANAATDLNANESIHLNLNTIHSTTNNASNVSRNGNSVAKESIYSSSANNHKASNGSSSFINVDNNNNNIANGNSTVQYNYNLNNNNNVYSSSTNDNISLHPNENPLLPQIRPGDHGKKCLIIDLDETLVHSSFKVSNADFVVPVEIDGIVHQVYVLKRPYVDEFLKRMGQLYECVLFTASLAKYADPVADLLDKWGVFRSRLFREACVYYRGNYVKDLSRLGRDLNKVIIIDNSPASYIFHPDNAVSCTSWFDDMHDRELLDLIPHFERLAASDSVYSILKQSKSSNFNNLLNNPLTSSNNHNYQQQSLIYAQQQQVNYDESASNQQVPSQQQQSHSIIYQQQQHTNNEHCELKETKNASMLNNYNYLLNENKILLSIDLMMATKQQQLQQQQQQQQQQ